MQASRILSTLFEGRFTPIDCVDEEEWPRCKANATHLCLTASLTLMSCKQSVHCWCINAVLEEGLCSAWVERLDLMKHTAHAHVHCNYHKLVKVCILLHQPPR